MFAELNTLRAPPDAMAAHRRFGATCGPCALAAALERNVADVIQHFPELHHKTFTNLPSMAHALRAAGISWSRCNDLPRAGLALMCGPQKYYSRHWIAVREQFVYEVCLDMWLPILVWRRDFLPVLAAEFDSLSRRWRVEAAFEIDICCQAAAAV